MLSTGIGKVWQNDNAVLLWHFGAALSMRDPDSVLRLGTHWILPSDYSGMTHFKLADGPITIARFDGEGGEYKLERDGDAIRFRVESCPAIAYLKEKGYEIDPSFCRGTVVLNRALAEDTPFEITTEVLGDGQCVQTIRKAEA